MKKKEGRRPGRPREPIERSRLLSLAAEAFAARGYAGASMSHIAEAAGLRKASLFHHFSSKEQLYLEVLGEIVADLAQVVSEAGALPESFLERLDQMGGLAVTYFGAHQHAARLLLREMIDGGSFAKGPGRVVIEGTLAGIVGFLQEGIDEGVVQPQDPRHLALSIVGVHLMWFAIDDYSGWLIDGDPHCPEEIEGRRRWVLTQVRRICGAPPLPHPPG